jgi:glycosyltransferase involved in cell wall biosynthesis
MPQTLISVVSPVYKAKEIVPELVRRVVLAVSQITDDFEVILIEDGCPDNSWDLILTECQKDSRIKGVKLSRNFGQHYAITAGLEVSSGDWVVVMDCDLQDRPEEIPCLFHKTKEGYDVVFGVRGNRQDLIFRKLASKLFYKLLSYLTDTKQDGMISNFGIYRKPIIESILSMNDRLRYFPTMCKWVGFRQTSILVKHSEREIGNSSYSYRKLFQLAFNNMFAFSEKPLWLMIKLGTIISIMSFFIGILYVYKFLHGQITEPGFTSLILSIWFLSGVIIIMLGVVGVYVGKTFEASKDRPLYIIQESQNI